MNNKEKITKEYPNGTIQVGYYSEENDFVYHSFDDQPSTILYDGEEWYHKDGVYHRDNNLPAIIYNNGEKYWYVNGEQYWYINDKQYFNIDEILEKYKDKIIKIKGNISQNLTDMNIDYVHIKLVWDDKNNIWYNQFIILNDSDRNEVILKYG